MHVLLRPTYIGNNCPQGVQRAKTRTTVVTNAASVDFGVKVIDAHDYDHIFDIAQSACHTIQST